MILAVLYMKKFVGDALSKRSALSRSKAGVIDIHRLRIHNRWSSIQFSLRWCDSPSVSISRKLSGQINRCKNRASDVGDRSTGSGNDCIRITRDVELDLCGGRGIKYRRY